LLEDDDLEPLRRRPELAAIVRESARARTAAPRADSLEPVVLARSGESSGGAAPAALVLALHGWGQDADEFALHWRAAAERGYTVIVPRSSQQPTPGFFVWDDRQTARAEVAAQFRRACGLASDGAGPGVAAAPLLLAGFSQGGGLAVDLAIDAEPAPSAGFLAVAAGAEDLAEPPGPDRLAPAAARGLRGRILVGDRDEALDGARVLAAAAATAGLSWPLTVRPGAGHEMPEPPGEPLAGELAAILG
jgi:predicted esterase